MDSFFVANMEQCHFVNVAEQVEEQDQCFTMLNTEYVPWSFEVYSNSEPSIVDNVDDDEVVEFEECVAGIEVDGTNQPKSEPPDAVEDQSD